MNEITEKQIAEDLKAVLSEAKHMEINKVAYFRNIPYRNIELVIAALEKQIPKKPIRNDLCTCPSCGTYNETVKKRRNTVNVDIVYCWHCGQAMEIRRDYL